MHISKKEKKNIQINKQKKSKFIHNLENIYNKFLRINLKSYLHCSLNGNNKNYILESCMILMQLYKKVAILSTKIFFSSDTNFLFTN